jgi:hypothetical protein
MSGQSQQTRQKRMRASNILSTHFGTNKNSFKGHSFHSNTSSSLPNSVSTSCQNNSSARSIPATENSPLDSQSDSAALWAGDNPIKCWGTLEPLVPGEALVVLGNAPVVRPKTNEFLAMKGSQIAMLILFGILS